MEAAPKVKEVLESAEFRAWLPEDRFYLELNAVLGFDRSRIVRFNKERIEIGTGRTIFIHCPWEDILEVEQIGVRGFTIVTKSGTAKVWWPSVGLAQDGYSQFLYHVFLAMTTGIEGSELGRYRLPAILEEGKTYEYRVPQQRFWAYRLLYALAVLMLILGIDKVIRGKFMDALTAVMPCLWLYGLHFTQRDIKNRTLGVRVKVNDGSITVDSPTNGSTKVPLHLLRGVLQPGVKPTPFTGVETYGGAKESVLIDRRYLYEIH